MGNPLKMYQSALGSRKGPEQKCVCYPVSSRSSPVNFLLKIRFAFLPLIALNKSLATFSDNKNNITFGNITISAHTEYYHLSISKNTSVLLATYDHKFIGLPEPPVCCMLMRTALDREQHTIQIILKIPENPLAHIIKKLGLKLTSSEI